MKKLFAIFDSDMVDFLTFQILVELQKIVKLLTIDETERSLQK